MKKGISRILSCGLALAVCGTGFFGPASLADTGPGQGMSSTAGTSGAGLSGAAAYTGKVERATIDASVYLDYAAGIQAGVYKWIASEDGSYYTLAAVDGEGNPITTQESSINVGANNAEIGGAGGTQGGENGTPPSEGGTAGGGMQGMRGGMGAGGFGGGTVYQGIYMNANITNLSNQTMLVYVPAAYLAVDADGNVTGIQHEGKAGGYTADTAPIIYANECGGWKSSSPRSVDTSYIEQGMIYITAGARSRDAVDASGKPSGKSPTQVADLKSGVIALRANANVIPGDKERIVSIGTSGGGQMSSIFGASGDMPAYYPYLYEAGALGVTKNEDGSYASAYPDHIYAAQCYCPIADIEDADLAYAWWWVDLADKGGVYGDGFTAFDLRLQELEANAFIEYLNGLNLKDANGNALVLTGLRSGSYYDAVLQNVSDAMNAMVAAGELDPVTAYPGAVGSWLGQDLDGSWKVMDMAGFMVGTGLVSKRNKPVPGFDAMDKSAENDAFGTSDEDAVHFSRSVAQILSDNYAELSQLEGFDASQVDDYISEALTGDQAEFVHQQTNLMNATEILLGYDGLQAVHPAQYWRDRSGTADQHTSFSVGYNLCLAAASRGLDTDYHLVWNMEHGSNEGSSTGTFIDWVKRICPADAG